MTDTDIVTRLAREAGAYFANDDCDDCREITFADAEDLARFAALLVEECAKVCEAWNDGYDPNSQGCAAAIRARFVHSPKPLT